MVARRSRHLATRICEVAPANGAPSRRLDTVAKRSCNFTTTICEIAPTNGAPSRRLGLVAKRNRHFATRICELAQANGAPSRRLGMVVEKSRHFTTRIRKGRSESDVFYRPAGGRVARIASPSAPGGRILDRGGVLHGGHANILDSVRNSGGKSGCRTQSGRCGPKRPAFCHEDTQSCRKR